MSDSVIQFIAHCAQSSQVRMHFQELANSSSSCGRKHVFVSHIFCDNMSCAVVESLYFTSAELHYL